MHSIILANGDGQRFKDAGYQTPKHLLPFGETTVIGTIARKLPPHAKKTAITRKSSISRTADEFALFGDVVGLKEKRGPLGDLLQLPAIDDDQELLINYCDCWMDDYTAFIQKCRSMKFDAGVVTFSSTDPRHDQLIIGVAFGGIYYFRTGALFKEVAPKLDPHSSVLAAVYQHEYTIHMSYSYTDVGVPEDYEKCQLQLKSI